MMSVVPEADDGAFEAVLVAEGAEAGGAEEERDAMGRQREADPAGGEDAEEVAAGKEEGVAVDGAEAGNDAVGTGSDGFDGLAVGGPVAEELPVWILGANLLATKAFVVAVVPFNKVGIDVGDGRETGEGTGAAGALKGAGPDGFELNAGEAGAEFRGVEFTLRGEEEIGEAGVLGGEGPGGFSVPGEVDCGEQLLG